MNIDVELKHFFTFVYREKPTVHHST